MTTTPITSSQASQTGAANSAPTPKEWNEALADARQCAYNGCDFDSYLDIARKFQQRGITINPNELHRHIQDEMKKPFDGEKSLKTDSAGLKRQRS